MSGAGGGSQALEARARGRLGTRDQGSGSAMRCQVAAFPRSADGEQVARGRIRLGDGGGYSSGDKKLGKGAGKEKSPDRSCDVYENK